MSRVALVTGGSRGIGAAISKALKAAGYKVAANYAGNDEAAQKFKSETGISVYKWDVSSYDACAAGIKQVEADLGERGVDDVVAVGRAALVGRRERRDRGDADAGGLVDGAHPVGVARGEVVVDRGDVDAAPVARRQHRCQRADEGLALAGGQVDDPTQIGRAHV